MLPARVVVLLTEALVVALCTTAPSDAVEPELVRLRWSAPAQCPDRETIVQRLETLVGHRPVEIDAEGSIERDEGGYVLRMHTRSRDGEGGRTLRSDDCRMLGEAAALVLALTADTPGLLRRVGGPESEPRPEPEPEPEPLPQPAPTPQPEPEPVTPGSPRLALRFAGVGGVGLLPGFSPAVALTLAVFGRSWRVETGWLHAFARRARADIVEEVQGDIQLSTAVVRAGWVYRHKRLEVPLMGGVDLGSLRVTTALQNGVQRRLWFAFSAGPSIAWEPHPNVALMAGIDAVFPYLRPAFVIESAGTLHAVPPVAARGMAGLEVRLP